MLKKIVTFFIGITVLGAMLLITEIIIRKSGLMMTYTERIGYDYVCPYNNNIGPAIIRPGNPESLIRRSSPGEFNYSYRANKDGFIANNVHAKKQKEFRIFCIGDSFTQGIGSPQGYSWPDYLCRNLKDRFPKKDISVFNYGASGSDPVAYYVLLRDLVIDYQPDLVIIGINNSDLGDVLSRGGVERLSRSGDEIVLPWWSIIYQKFHLFRLISRRNNYLLTPGQMKRAEKEAAGKIIDVLEKINEMNHEKGIRTLIVSHDNLMQNHQYYLDRLRRIGYFDLFLDYIDINGNQIQFWNKRYVWPIDGHLTSNGYEMFGKAIADFVFSGKYIKK